jgi:hypothetical protein
MKQIYSPIPSKVASLLCFPESLFKPNLKQRRTVKIYRQISAFLVIKCYQSKQGTWILGSQS